MKRRKFVEQSLALSALTLLSSSVDLNAQENVSCDLNLGSFISRGKSTVISGLAIDAVSKEPIEAKIEIKSDSGFYTKTRNGIINNGQYSITGNLLDKGNHKISVKIVAQGYKTFCGALYLTKNGCRIDSDMWSYNPDFKAELIPKNEITSEFIHSKFNFHLVHA